MRIQCPQCSSQYNVDEKRIPPQGVQIKCPKCTHAFVVHAPEEDESTQMVPADAVALPGASRAAPAADAVALPGSRAASGGGAVPLPGQARGGAVPLPGGRPAEDQDPGAVPLPGGRPAAQAGAVPLPGGRPAAQAGAVPLPGGRPAAQAGAVPLPGGRPAAPAGAVPLPGGRGADGAVALPGAIAMDDDVPYADAESLDGGGLDEGNPFGAPAGDDPFGGAVALPGGPGAVALPGGPGAVALPGGPGAVALPGGPGAVALPGSNPFGGGAAYDNGAVPLPGEDPFGDNALDAGGVPLPGANPFGDLDPGAVALPGGPGAVPLPGAGDFNPFDASAPPEAERDPFDMSPPPAAPPPRSAAFSPASFGDSALGPPGGKAVRSEDSVVMPFHGDSRVGPAPAQSQASLDANVLDFIDQEVAAEARAQASKKKAGYRIRKRSGKVQGPYDVPTLMGMLKKQELQGTEEASEDGANWKPLSAIPVFAEELQRMMASALGEGGDEETAFPGGKSPTAAGSAVSVPSMADLEEAAPVVPAATKPKTRRTGLVAGLGAAGLLVVAGVTLEFVTPQLGLLGGKPLSALLGLSGDTLTDGPATPQPGPAAAAVNWQSASVDQLIAEDTLAGYEEAQRKLSAELQAGNTAVALPLARVQALMGYLDAVPEAATQALRTLERAPGADPKAVAAVKVWAQLAQKKDEDALKTGVEAAGAAPPELKDLSEAARMAISDVQTATGYALLAKPGTKVDEVLPRFDWALMAWPQNLLATLGQAQALLLGNDPESALGYVDRAVLMQKENVRARLKLAQLQLKSGNSSAAKEHLQAVVGKLASKGTPGQRAEAHALLGDVALQEHDLKLAAEHIQAAATERPDDVSIKLRSGELLLRLRDWPQARATFDELLVKNPTLEQAIIGSARAKLANDALGAYKQLQDATVKYPQNAALCLWFGKAAEVLGKPLDAVAQYKKAVTLDPKRAGPVVELATMAVRERRFPDAISLLQEARGRVAQDEEGRLRATLGWVYTKQRNFNLAFAEFDAALTANPSDYEARALYGAALRDAGKLEQAAKNLQAAMAEDPRNPLIIAEMGSYHLAKGQNDKAIDMFQQAIGISPKEDDYFVRLGAAQYAKGDNAAAMEFLRKAQSLNPTNPDMFYWMALVSRARGDVDKAKSLLKQGMELSPEDDRFDHEMGRTFFNEGIYMEALDYFRASVRKNPGNGPAHYDFGRTLEEQSRYAEARTEYQEAAKLMPKFGPARLHMADTYTKTGDYASAAKEYQKALQDDPGLSEANCKLGDVYRTDGKYKQAAGKYERCLESDPNHKEAWKWLGYTYESMGARFAKKALHAWEKHLKMHPDDPEADTVRDKISEMKGG